MEWDSFMRVGFYADFRRHWISKNRPSSHHSLNVLFFQLLDNHDRRIFALPCPRLSVSSFTAQQSVYTPPVFSFQSLRHRELFSFLAGTHYTRLVGHNIVLKI